MRHSKGFTVIELMICLTIAVILVTIAAPSLNDLIRHNRLEVTTNQLLESVYTARSYAVKTNSRVTMSTNQSWNHGWRIHLDPNHNGERDSSETVLVRFEPLHESIEVLGNRPVADYISYLGNGESRWASGYKGGGFQAGTLTICPKGGGSGYELILARGGRLRKEDYNCDNSA